MFRQYKVSKKYIEVILIDDGSNDPLTIEFLDKLEKENMKSNLRIIRIKNSGICKARNIGVLNSKGNYILMLDADDKLYFKFLIEAKDILDKNSEIGIVKGNIVTLSGKETRN